MNTPGPAAPPELQFRLQVDAALCERAAQGLRVMAQHQYRSQVRRHESLAWLRRMQRVAGKAAAAIGVLAFLGALAAVGVSRIDRATRYPWLLLAAILFVEAALLWGVSRRGARMSAGVRTWFEGVFGNWGAARMRKARRAVPFEAVYDLRGDLLSYARVENGRWTPLWHRHLDKLRPRGVALRTPDVLAIFSKPGAVLPTVLVLMRGDADDADDGGIAAAIRALGWTIVDIDPATGEARAPAAG